VEYTINTLSTNKANSKVHRTPFNLVGENKLKNLHSYFNILNNERINVELGGKGCLDCNQLQALAEKIRKITISCDKSAKKDFSSDKSNIQAWISKNPNCVAREKWEELAYTVCGEFKLDIISTEIKCDITFDIVKQIIPCDIIVVLSAREEVCNLDLKITRTEEECKLDFEILSEKINCDLTFSAYKTLVENNFSYDMIESIYENGCSIVVDDSEIRIHTAQFSTQYN
jgi:hypothetical protein